MHSLTHTIGNTRLIECLVGQNCHFDFIPHPHEQESPLSTVDGGLADQLIEGLSVKVFTDGADTSFTGLTLLKFLVELGLQVADILSGSWDWGNVLEPKLSIFFIFVGRQNGIQIIFGL